MRTLIILIILFVGLNIVFVEARDTNQQFAVNSQATKDSWQNKEKAICLALQARNIDAAANVAIAAMQNLQNAKVAENDPILERLFTCDIADTVQSLLVKDFHSKTAEALVRYKLFVAQKLFGSESVAYCDSLCDWLMIVMRKTDQQEIDRYGRQQKMLTAKLSQGAKAPLYKEWHNMRLAHLQQLMSTQMAIIEKREQPYKQTHHEQVKTDSANNRATSFNSWFEQGQNEYQKRTVWANESCPEAVNCFAKALQCWTPADGTARKLDALSLRADLLTLQGKNEEAIADYTKAINIIPDDFRFYARRGVALLLLEKYDLSIADFSKAIELKEHSTGINQYKDIKTILVDRELPHCIYYRLGVAYYKKKDFLKAIPELTKAINEDKLGEYYRRRGRAYNCLHQYDNAIEDFSKSIELPCSSEEDYQERGYSYTQKGEYIKAVADFSKANEREKDPVRLWFNFHERAFAYGKLGQFEKANQDKAQEERYKQWKGFWQRLSDLPPD